MFLKHLTILNYKNIEDADLDLSPKINCFIGNNGEGKTNLLDAVYYLSFCKSYAYTTDNQNITHNKDFFMLNGIYNKNDEILDISCGYKIKQKKQFKRNKKEYEKISDHIGEIPLVIVSPNDTELILSGSEERRKFIDRFISQYNKQYLNALISYNKALIQRNSMLKNEISDKILYSIVENQMNDFGHFVFQKRTEFIQQFIPYFQKFHEHISQGKEIVELIYRSQLQNNTKLDELLNESRQKDLILGHSTQGIHRDDLEMNVNNFPIKKMSSQGQIKTFLFALKLAQFDFLKQINKIKPILIFDDIFDKLDSNRVEQIIKLLKEKHFGQVFISDTNRENISDILKDSGCLYHLYDVKNGEIKLIEKKE